MHSYTKQAVKMDDAQQMDVLSCNEKNLQRLWISHVGLSVG